MSQILAARFLSLLGHPALLTSVAFTLGTLSKHPSPLTLRFAMAGSIFVASAIVVYSWRQVRSGHWSHVDASASHERQQINIFLMALFFAIAAIMVAVSTSGPLVWAPFLSGILVAVGQVLRPRMKLSLHVSFAVFAAFLLWPLLAGVLALLLLASGVAWSRLRLGRHTPAEVFAGSLAGCSAGLVFITLAN